MTWTRKAGDQLAALGERLVETSMFGDVLSPTYQSPVTSVVRLCDATRIVSDASEFI
jgi:hypothetical protein